MNICVEAGDWGDAQLNDIQKLLEDVSDQFLRHFRNIPNSTIRVQCCPNRWAPCILYRNSLNDDFVILLTSQNRSWAKYTYQFAHELCHFASDFERLQLLANQWFHESLCELASIFTLKQMAITWQSNPPYSNWASYSSELASYADEFVNRNEHQLPTGVSLADWYRTNESTLRGDRYQRTLNGIVAVQLLPFLQSSPVYWQSIQYMPNTDEQFSDFISAWYATCPDDQRAFPIFVAQQFQIELT